MEELLQELFARYQRDVYRYLYHLSRNAALSEELTAETFLEVVQSVHRFRGDSDVKTWLFSIARHRWFAHLRRQHRQVETALLDDFLESPAPSLEASVCTHELAERFQTLLAQEPERTRTIVELRLQGVSFHEIAQQTGVSESSARVIAFRARKRIQTQLTKEGFLDESTQL